MQSSHTPSCKDNRSANSKQPWHRSLLLVVAMSLIATVLCIGALANYEFKMEIQTTMLNVQRDGCEYLKQNGASIQISENGTCRFEGRFRANLIGSGGHVYIGNKVIQLADTQVVAVAAIENQTLAPEQRSAYKLLLISVILVLGSLGWMIYLLTAKGAKE